MRLEAGRGGNGAEAQMGENRAGLGQGPGGGKEGLVGETFRRLSGRP